ncbi:hypothetical protein [Pseudoalteromonas sp. KAN5]|uniref:hypothetical protein n=1 Tax=Pseudoalteromonas sp. KAN5 TaxID=2916633 RepID=UPI001FCC82D7|nr:hypothetical protein [Pseudoalteromonas sp. KAN5]BDF94306.1 hypothetical protein KAN5_11440 [Pseudoalteromonas sp. KAN5]
METVDKVVKWLIKDWFKVQEDIALHENKLFWLVVLAPLFFITWLSWRLTEELITKGLYNPHVSAESLAGFVSYYAFPIALLTVPLTLAVMINRFHSSKQKAKSNRLVEQNNTANNFFNHYKYFCDHCEAIRQRYSKGVLVLKPEVLYKKLFIHSSINNLNAELNLDFIQHYFNELLPIGQSFQNHSNQFHDIIFQQVRDDLEPLEIHIFVEPFIYRLDFSGLSYRTSIEQESHFSSQLDQYYDILYALICFNGVSNYHEVCEYTNKMYAILRADCIDD